MKKLFILLAVFALLLTGCGSTPDVSQLERDIDALQHQVDDLSARLDALEKNSGLLDWHMNAVSRSDNSGAAITLTASPLAYHEGQSAVFSVRLGTLEVASVPCQWNGSVYTGVVDLDRRQLDMLDYAIAGIHGLCYEDVGVVKNSDNVISCMNAPKVKFNSHPAADTYP